MTMRIIRAKSGFTLAEVLITLGVIGVVAAITIPTLMQNTQNQALKSQLKKEISVTESAFKQAAVDNGGSLAGYSSQAGVTILRSNDLMDIVQPYLSVIKKCYQAEANTCSPITTPYKTYSGDDYPADWASAPGWYPLLVLKDGAIVYFSAWYPDMGTCTNNWITSTQDSCGDITIDTNGIKGPNQAGYDVFEFYVGSTGTLTPVGTKNDVWKDAYSKTIGYDKILDMLN